MKPGHPFYKNEHSSAHFHVPFWNVKLSSFKLRSVLSLYCNAHLPPWAIRKVPQPKPNLDQAPNRPESHHWKLLSLLLLILLMMMRTLAGKQPRPAVPPGHQLELSVSLTGLKRTLQTVKSSSLTQLRMPRMRVDENVFQRAQNLNSTKWSRRLSSLQM